MPKVNITPTVPVNLDVYCCQCYKPLDIFVFINPEEQTISLGITPGHICKVKTQPSIKIAELTAAPITPTKPDKAPPIPVDPPALHRFMITPITNQPDQHHFQALCQMCHKAHSVKVDFDAYKSWLSGELIQNAMPDLSPIDREFLISHYCPGCQELIFSKPKSE